MVSSLLLLLSFYVLTLLAYGHNIFIHSQQDFGNRGIPELQQMSEFYGQVTRTMRLADGRSAECMIPVFSPLYQNYIPVVDEEFHQVRITQTAQQSPQPEDIIQLSQEDADYALRSLENQCAEYRTKSFLWQFCYKKYLRQFDDILTLVVAQKKEFEDIYAGYHSSYNKTTNITKDKVIPSLSTFNYFQVEDKTVSKAIKYSDTIYKMNPHISKPNITQEQPYIFTEGKVIQFVGFSNLSLSSKSQVVITIERTDEKKKKLQKVKVIHMIDRSFGLLKEPFPRAETIIKYSLEVIEVDSVERNANVLSLYDGIYLYGKRLSALSHLSKGDLLIITTYKGALLKEIKRVINNSFIELQQDQSVGLKGQSVFIDTIQVYSRGSEGKSLLNYEIVEFQKKERFLSGSILLGVNYLWAEIGDQLLFVSRNKIISSIILQILPSGVAIDQNLNNFNGYIIKANYQSFQKEDYLEIANGQFILYVNPRSYKVNSNGSKKPSIKPGYLLFKQSNKRQEEDILEYTDLESFQLNQNEATSPFRYFMFTPSTVLGEEFKQLKLLLSSSLSDKKEEVQIDFSSDDKIFAYDGLFKSNIASKNKRYENVTLFNPSRVWILVDNQGFVRLGFSDVISPSTQALSLKTNYTNLRFLRVITKQTYNIEILTPISGSFDNPLDFTVLDSHSQLHSNSTVKEVHYDNGEFCPPINRSRSFSVEYVCGDSFFSLIHVSEPSVCSYHVLVETYLLCPHKSSSFSIPSPPKNVHCILKNQNMQHSQLLK